MPAIELQDVGLRYGRPMDRGRAEVLRDLSFSVGAGEFRWLLGPSGAGKSSLIRLLHLAQRPSTGRLSLFGVATDRMARAALPRLRRRIGVVHQDFRLLPELTVYDNVALPLRLAHQPESQIRNEVGDMLGWLGLGGRLHARPAQLSGGEQQRVAVARAVIARPALLLADEPTGHLDEAQAIRIVRLFTELNQLGSTVVVATHNMSLVTRFPAPSLRLSQGRMAPPDMQPPAPAADPRPSLSRPEPRPRRRFSLSRAVAIAGRDG